MIYIDSKPNPSGAYPNPKNQPFPGSITLNDEQAAVFFEYNGFVIVENGSVTPNIEAWEAWKAEMAEQAALAESVAPEPTAEEQLRADVDYIAAMTDIVL